MKTFDISDPRNRSFDLDPKVKLQGFQKYGFTLKNILDLQMSLTVVLEMNTVGFWDILYDLNDLLSQDPKVAAFDPYSLYPKLMIFFCFGQKL